VNIVMCRRLLVFFSSVSTLITSSNRTYGGVFLLRSYYDYSPPGLVKDQPVPWKLFECETILMHIFSLVQSKDLDFQRHISWSFLCSIIEIRGDFWSCYLWSSWWSLFKLSFHELIWIRSGIWGVFLLYTATTVYVY